jgi:hypothetical protein
LLAQGQVLGGQSRGPEQGSKVMKQVQKKVHAAKIGRGLPLASGQRGQISGEGASSSRWLEATRGQARCQGRALARL